MMTWSQFDFGNQKIYFLLWALNIYSLGTQVTLHEYVLYVYDVSFNCKTIIII